MFITGQCDYYLTAYESVFSFIMELTKEKIKLDYKEEEAEEEVAVEEKEQNVLLPKGAYTRDTKVTPVT